MKKDSQFSIGSARAKASLNSQLFRLTPYIAFLGALAVYWLTVDPGASYWDCPEYLITALRLEVGHPPGNPGWALAHRFISCFFPDPAMQVRVVNMMSGLFTALSVMILCSVSISAMLWIWPKKKSGNWRKIAISVSSLAGSLCFAWSDSAWYSAVEAEVYAMSLFFSSLTVWMALKWAFSFSLSARARWLVALAYVIGFSLGVHQLNLLALPAILMIMAVGSSRNTNKNNCRRLIFAFFAGCAAVVFILKGLMPGSVAIAGWADMLAVNSFGMPYWSGALIFWLFSFAVVVVGAVLSNLYNRHISVGLWCLAAVMAGFSVFIIIPIRAWANPPINEGNPSDIFRFTDYLDRRQYGESPLFYGRTPYSRIMRIERVSVNDSGDTIRDYSWNALTPRRRDLRPMVSGGHIPDRSRFLTDADRDLNERISQRAVDKPHGYIVSGYRITPRYTPELDMWLPRIYASSPGDIMAYRDWTCMDSSNMVQVRISEAFDSVGRPVPIKNVAGVADVKYAMRPTYLQSLMYLFGYQIGYMYFRYLMWNYAGRQNDVSSTGEIDHGNFITGFALVDDYMLGPQSKLPSELGSHNAGRNVYWSIPFILGVIGIVWLFKGVRRRRIAIRMGYVAWVSLILFIMTGIAIVLYLNQTSGQPRERDYSFMGSFWTFAIWISFGMLLILKSARKKIIRAALIAAVCAVPLRMLAVNYRDHDRSHRSATLDYATNLLESLDEDAIIFVDGDNYIFPLWFAQEVMGVRRDVAVICNAYLGSDWYVRQLMTSRYGYEGVKMTASEGDIAFGNYNITRFPSALSDTAYAIDALRSLYSDSSPIPSFKNRWLVMGKDSADFWVFDLLSVPGKGDSSLAGLREVAEIDIVATNAASRYPRPVYWHQQLQEDKLVGFFPFTSQALFSRKLMPLAPDTLVLLDEALDALPEMRWGGLDRAPYPGVDVSREAANQRASMIRLAESLAAAGRHDQALHVAKSALVRFPSDLVPFSIRRHMDSIYFEARQVACVLCHSGEVCGDTAAISLGRSIMTADSIRFLAFRRYRESLPRSRRSALSPDSRNHAINTSKK